MALDPKALRYASFETLGFCRSQQPAPKSDEDTAKVLETSSALLASRLIRANTGA